MRGSRQLDITCLELPQEVVVVHQGQGVHVLHRRGVRALVLRCGGGKCVPRVDALKVRQRLALEDPLSEDREDDVSLAGHGSVHAGELTYEFNPRDTPALGPAEDGRHLRAKRLDAFGQGQRGQLLLEHAGEPDNTRPEPQDFLHAPIQKGRYPGLHAPNSPDDPFRDGLPKMAVGPGRVPEHLLHVACRLVLAAREQRAGESPLTELMVVAMLELLGYRQVGVQAHRFGETQIQVKNPSAYPPGGQARLQQAQPQRGADQCVHGHADQRDLR